MGIAGQTALALKQICAALGRKYGGHFSHQGGGVSQEPGEEAGATIAGYAFLALNRTQLVGQRPASVALNSSGGAVKFPGV